jgi:hypothetical protein
MNIAIHLPNHHQTNLKKLSHFQSSIFYQVCTKLQNLICLWLCWHLLQPQHRRSLFAMQFMAKKPTAHPLFKKQF